MHSLKDLDPLVSTYRGRFEKSVKLGPCKGLKSLVIKI